MVSLNLVKFNFSFNLIGLYRINCFFSNFGMAHVVSQIICHTKKTRIEMLKKSVQVSACELRSETISCTFGWCRYQNNHRLSWSLPFPKIPKMQVGLQLPLLYVILESRILCCQRLYRRSFKAAFSRFSNNPEMLKNLARNLLPERLSPLLRKPV